MEFYSPVRGRKLKSFLLFIFKIAIWNSIAPSGDGNFKSLLGKKIVRASFGEKVAGMGEKAFGEVASKD